MTLHSQRSRDRVSIVYSQSEERAGVFSNHWEIPAHTTSIEEAINHDEANQSWSVAAQLPP